MVKKVKLKEDINNTDKVFIANRGSADVYIDDYEQGEGDYVNGFNIDLRGKFTSLQQLITAVANEYYCCTDDINDWEFSVEQSALQTSAMVDNDNSLADERDIEMWKNGELTLYVCHLFIPVQIISKPRDVSREEAEAERIYVWD